MGARYLLFSLGGLLLSAAGATAAHAPVIEEINRRKACALHRDDQDAHQRWYVLPAAFTSVENLIIAYLTSSFTPTADSNR